LPGLSNLTQGRFSSCAVLRKRFLEYTEWAFTMVGCFRECSTS
jgi:hypothetical protein